MVVRFRGTCTEAGHYRALVTACRQIYLETKLPPHHSQHIVFHYDGLKYFCTGQVIDPIRLAVVRHVRLWYQLRLIDVVKFRLNRPSVRNPYSLDMLARLDGLMHLTVRLKVDDLGSRRVERYQKVVQWWAITEAVYRERLPNAKINFEPVPDLNSIHLGGAW
jgi:hypothetical protein